MAHLDVWPWIVVGFGSITMVLGAWIALQRDVLKQILAYTTISQLGLLACAFGLSHFTYDGKPNLVWGNIQILNHALYKAPLFILAGAVTHAIGPKALSGMVGWWHAGGDGGERKRYALLFLLALVALAALPGTMSFFAKEAFLYQIWHGFKETKSPLLIALLVGTVFTSVCNVAILIRFGRTFFATHDEEAEPHHGHHGHDTAFWTAMLWMPAALLIGLQYVGGLFGPLVAPTLATIEASAFYPKDPLDLFSLWYVVTHPGVPLLASLIGIVIGVVLGLSNVWSGFRGDVHDRIFPGSYNGILGGGRFVFGLFQTGQLRWYVTATTLTIVGIIVWTGWTAWMPLLAKAWGEVQAEGGLPDFWIDPAAWMLPLAICVAALMTVVVRRRVPRVLVIGTVGFAVSGLFYHYAAPDLALTQLSVEIVSLILFLLVLNLLPDPKTLKPRTFLVPRIIVAIAIGTTAGFIAFIASTGERPQRVVSLSTPEDKTTLGDFFLRNSYSGKDLVGVDPDRLGEGVVDRGESHLTSFGSKIKAEPAYEGDDAVAVSKGGGGGNVVNVILVDFRGFDTFGEIGVLGIAAMGVWTLLRKPPSEQDIDAKDNRSEPSADTFEEPNGPIPFDALTMNGIRGDHPVRSQNIASDILKTASWLLLPLALVFAAFLFFKGHQEPGGGFVGGLAAAVALVVFRMCFGCQALYDLLPVRERTMIGIGLLLASLTAVVPLLFGLPLLTSNNGYLPLIGGGSYHWSTVIVFDLGVFLVVVGSIVGMADALARELES
jgi:multicomponent K+:H+ antiporter subunit A